MSRASNGVGIWINADPFHILELTPDARPEQIKRAFRTLAMRWHPDRNASPEAEERFKLLRSAYELALDKERYQAWKRESGVSESPGTSAQARWSQHSRRGGVPPSSTAQEPDNAERDEAEFEPESEKIDISLEMAARGGVHRMKVRKPQPCIHCHGQGVRHHGHSVPCSQCHGVGRVRGSVSGKRSADGQCCACAGRGYVRESVCHYCAGQGVIENLSEIDVVIPAGVVSGERLRLRKGGKSRREVLLEVQILPDPVWRLVGRDLWAEIPVPWLWGITGGVLELPVLGRVLRIDVPPSAFDALGAGGVAEWRVEGKGFPQRGEAPGGTGGGSGDLCLQMRLVRPRHLKPGEVSNLRDIQGRLDERVSETAPEIAVWQDMLR